MRTLQFTRSRKVAKRMTRLYTIAILPPEPILTEVNTIKKHIATNFGLRAALSIPAQITLQQPTSLPEWTESALIRQLEAFSRQLKPFELSIDGFDCKENQSLYLNIDNNKGINTSYKSLMKFLKNDLSFTTAKIKKDFTPLITVAYKDLTPEIFPQLKASYLDKSYKRTFTVRKIALLKHNYRQWEVLSELPFSNDLFGQCA